MLQFAGQVSSEIDKLVHGQDLSQSDSAKGFFGITPKV